MKFGAGLLCLSLSFAATNGFALTTLLDDFDGGGVAAGTRAVTPTPGTFTGGGQMFEPGNRGSLLTNGTTGLPFSISDDSVVPAEGNTQFANDLGGIFGQAKTDSFFGVSDTVNPGNPDGLAFATWTIDTSGLSGLMLQVDVGAMGDFEGLTGGGGAAAADAYSFSVSFDNGGTFTPVMVFGADDDIAAGTYRPMDSGMVADALPDPLWYLGPDGVLGGGDDVQLNKSDPDTGVIDTLTAAIPGSGASMILRFDARTDGTAEGFAFDNLRLISGEGPASDADFDNSGTVDGADFLIWQRGLGPGTDSTGDATGDGAVNGADLAAWASAFGGAPAGASIGAVPEPSAMVMGGLAALAAAGVGRRRS